MADRLLEPERVDDARKASVAEQPNFMIAALGGDRRRQDRPQRRRLAGRDGRGAWGDRRASKSFILPTELFSVAIMSARNSALSAWRSALRESSDNWLTRFLMSCRMKAKRRLNSSKRRALDSASWPWASASELAAWRPAVRNRSKSSQSSARR